MCNCGAVAVLRQVMQALEKRNTAKAALENCNRRTSAGRVAYPGLSASYAVSCSEASSALRAARAFLASVEVEG